MFRIRRVPDDTGTANAAAIRQVQEILRAQFPGLEEEEADSLPDKLRNPLKRRLRALLFVAEDAQDRVQGFALMFHAPDLDFCYLDFVAAGTGRVGGGVGGALYERVREEALALGATGLFLECLPDDPALSRDPEVRKQNADRLRFYERYGARPIANTAYETPLGGDGDNPPYLVFDGLGLDQPPERERARRIVRAILERKYGDTCPPSYIDMVVRSFEDDPIVLRAPQYRRKEPDSLVRVSATLDVRIPIVVNDKHEIHHVADRGYVQAPVRIRSITTELEKLHLFNRVEARGFPETMIRAVHGGRFVDYLKRACAQVEPKRSIYPYVFPVRNAARPPKDLPLRAGYYCIDTFTPLNANAFLAARQAVDCALTAAALVLEGHHFAYALVRPPGHHAERRAFGGFCYFNNSAIAANYLSRYGRVAVLDIDYHHGNGTQDIFYQRGDVLTVSIHGHPSFAYPYFAGFADEQGLGPGTGANLNIPLPETITAEQYRAALDQALRRIARFAPDFLVLALGLDTAAGDPTGSWPHRAADFAAIGRTIGLRNYPTVVVQEGGYRTRTLGVNARNFFQGLWQGGRDALPAKPARRAKATPTAAPEFEFRLLPGVEDVEAVRSLVARSGVFSTEEVLVARELVEERLSRGPDSGYHFVFAEWAGRLVGYACYGPIPATERRFDLYWIAVDPDERRAGLGAALLRRVEEEVAGQGGELLYVETSSRDVYEPARRFYRKGGFRKAAELPDFYRPGDGKMIFLKTLAEPARAA